MEFLVKQPSVAGIINPGNGPGNPVAGSGHIADHQVAGVIRGASSQNFGFIDTGLIQYLRVGGMTFIDNFGG